jgi:hypothetical protein
MAIKPLVTSRTMWCCLMDSEWHFYHGLTSLPTNVDPGRGNTCALDYQSWQFIGLITTTVITFRPGMEYRAMGIFGIISESSWRMCMEMMRVDAPKHKYLFQGYILILKLLTSLWLSNTLYCASSCCEQMDWVLFVIPLLHGTFKKCSTTSTWTPIKGLLDYSIDSYDLSAGHYEQTFTYPCRQMVNSRWDNI